MSTDDIQKGQYWASELRRVLKRQNCGIFCVTPENYSAPWLTFEAGALSNAPGKSRVFPLLLGLVQEELEGPMQLFQITTLERQDMLRLLSRLNSETEEPLDKTMLRSRFDRHWPKLLDGTQAIFRQELPADSATVSSIIRALARNGIERSTTYFQVSFSTGFETHALYSTITEVARKQLLIFGRKNRKLFDRDHEAFFADLKSRIGQGFDFRIMFLDPNAPSDVLARAHRDEDFADQLRAAIRHAQRLFERYRLDWQQHVRLYNIPRTISFAIADGAILYSTLELDDKGRARPLTRAPFSVTGAASPMGRDMIRNFETLWSLGTAGIS